MMPEQLKEGDFFRLTGDAENPEERADDGLYEVIDLDRRTTILPASGNLPEREILTGLSALVRRDGEGPFVISIGPWVPLISVETPPEWGLTPEARRQLKEECLK